jgi:hypothetical protein
MFAAQHQSMNPLSGQLQHAVFDKGLVALVDNQSAKSVKIAVVALTFE